MSNDVTINVYNGKKKTASATASFGNVAIKRWFVSVITIWDCHLALLFSYVWTKFCSSSVDVSFYDSVMVPSMPLMSASTSVSVSAAALYCWNFNVWGNIYEKNFTTNHTYITCISTVCTILGIQISNHKNWKRKPAAVNKQARSRDNHR